MNINLEWYRIFYSVAKNKNITKAAAELRISQPAVSKYIKNLENQFDCSLFVRTKYGVVLTEEGKAIYEHVSKALELIHHAEESVLEMIHMETGVLNIGISNTLTQKYLLPFIEKFHELYPKIKIKIITSPTFELIIKARNGLLDLIVLNLPYQVPNDFKEQKLKTIHDCFVASKKFEYLKGKTLSLKELNEYPLILISKGSNTRLFLDTVCLENDVVLVPEMELTSYSLVTQFTKIGLGIGYVTKEYLDKELEDGTLFEIKIKEKIENRSIGMIYMEQKILSNSSKKFLELLEGDNI